MPAIRNSIFVLTTAILAAEALAAAEPPADPVSPDAGPARWTNGPPTDDTYFPIGVWLQNPRHAMRYRDAGINLYVGLWNGPTQAQLAELKAAGLRVICAQSRTGLESADNDAIIGWMHGDEPDNAQSLGRGKGYGPPVPPEEVVRDYERMRATDPTRPVLLNLGQGVAWDNWIGRGVRRRHPEDYPLYLEGCDIASFDIYPAVHDSPEVAGKLEFVARGVERLVEWTGGRKPVWSCIECTRISNVKVKPTPDQVRSEVWMAIIRGARGLIYFVHQFEPEFREAALLDDPEMLTAVTAINRQVRELAPVLRSPTVSDPTAVLSPAPESSIASVFKRHGDSLYLFTANLSPRAARASITARGLPAGAVAELIGDSRRIAINDGSFGEEWPGYGVRLYRLRKN